MDNSIVLLCSGLKRAGQENVVYNLACGLKGNGYKVFVVSLYGGGYAKLLNLAGVETFIVEDELKERALKNSVLNRVSTLVKILNNTKSRAILIHGLGFERVWPIVNVFIHNMLTVFVFHNNYGILDRKHSVRLLVFKVFLGYMDKMVFINTEMKRRVLEKIRIKDTTQLYVIPNGINSSTQEVDRASFLGNIGIDKNRNVLIQVGRFVAQKNQLDTIRAFVESESLQNNCHLILLGDGELYETCEELVNSSGLKDCVYMPGNVPNVRDYLSVADIFLLPSSFEGHPISLIEAYFSNLPCIVYDSPGINDFFPDAIDSLFYVRHRDALSRQIVSVIKAKQEILNSSIYKSSLSYVRDNFSSEKMVDNYIDILSS